MLHPGVTQEWVDKGELPREPPKIGDSRGSTICMIKSYWELHFSVGHNKKKGYGFKESMSWYRRELLGGHSGVEVGGRKGRGRDDKSSGAQLPKSKALVRKEVDSKEHHSVVEVNLPIAKEGMHMQENG
ncbi:hypothetical protein BHM03_00014956 [Ensete ventricosum]|nr:hypothetical protein BHM03_00014956 [Ensete ventricosum]